MVQEAKDKTYSKCKDKWTLPHGSYDREGEDSLGLVKRELLEETGGEASFDGRCIFVEGYSTLQNKILLVCATWYASDWKKIGERWTDEIKDVKFFSKEEISELISSNQVRDNLPVPEIIDQFEMGKNQLVKWILSER